MCVIIDVGAHPGDRSAAATKCGCGDLPLWPGRLCKSLGLTYSLPSLAQHSPSFVRPACCSLLPNAHRQTPALVCPFELCGLSTYLAGLFARRRAPAGSPSITTPAAPARAHKTESPLVATARPPLGFPVPAGRRSPVVAAAKVCRCAADVGVRRATCRPGCGPLMLLAVSDGGGGLASS